MTESDVAFFQQCVGAGLIAGRMLEVGSAKVQGVANLCDLARMAGVADTVGVDMQVFDGVDAVYDFSICEREFRNGWSLGQFSTVCIFNVLEHTYNPIDVLRNALSCVEPYGTLVAVTPSVWPVHGYPKDYVRLLPDWYEEFARRNNLELVESHFCWLSQFGIERICSANAAELPGYVSRGNKVPRGRYWISRLSHRVLNTYGRSHWATHSAIGVVFRSLKATS